jgi:hypothetical protein
MCVPIAAFAVPVAGGDGDVGLVAVSRTLPLVVFLLIGGAMADRPAPGIA